MKENIFELDELTKYDDDKMFKKSNIYTSLFVIIIISTIILLIILKKNLYYENDIYVDHNNKISYVLKQDYDYLQNNNFITINNKKYFYRINLIELINDTTIYYKVYLEIEGLDIPPGSIQKYRVLVKKESILNYIVRIMKGA